MREAPRELGEGFAVYSAELKRAATWLHVYGHYRPLPAGRERPLNSAENLTEELRNLPGIRPAQALLEPA